MILRRPKGLLWESVAKEELNAFLGSNTVYEGKLVFEGSVHIDGKFTGEISSEGTLVVGKGAVVDGTFHVGELLLSGQLTGEVVAKRRVVVHSSGVLEGRLRTPGLLTEEGGIIEGQITMRGPAQRPDQPGG